MSDISNLKVLFITKTLTTGGAASGARSLLKSLLAAGVQVIALDAYEYQQSTPIRALRIAERVIERLTHDPETHYSRLGPATFNLKKLYHAHKPDIIQLCDISGNTIRFADLSEVPCPVIHRMSDFWPYHGAYHYAENKPTQLTLADHLLKCFVFDGRAMPTYRVAPSHWLASHLKGKNITVIRNAVAIPHSVQPREAHDGKLRFGFISNQILDPRKGFSSISSLLRVFVKKTQTPVELQIFGKLSKKNLPEIENVNIVINPSFSHEQLCNIYGKFDILLCPSRRDNSPNVVTEALSHGVPVIGQSGTGMESYIQKQTGALLDFHSEELIINKQMFIEAVTCIKNNYASYSSSALGYARRELSPDIIGRKYLSLYQQLIKR